MLNLLTKSANVYNLQLDQSFCMLHQICGSQTGAKVKPGREGLSPNNVLNPQFAVLASLTFQRSSEDAHTAPKILYGAKTGMVIIDSCHHFPDV